MTDTTPTTVATPMMTPSSVRNARSLWRVSAAAETRKSSEVVTRASDRFFFLSPSFSMMTLSPSLTWRSTLKGPVTISCADGFGPFLTSIISSPAMPGLDLLERELAVLDV